jgi:hypothetical protein
VAETLPADLRAVHPDLVLVLAGLNDAWNSPSESGPLGWLARLRLVRLVRVLLSGVASPGSFELRTDEQGEIVVDRGEGGRRVNVAEAGATPPADEALRDRVRAGLQRIVDECRDFGSEPVLMSYAENGGPHSLVSGVARELAAADHVLFVDHERVFGGAFAREGHDALMFNEHHPNARGYALMARTVDDALAAAGRVPPPGPDDDPSAAPAGLPPAPPTLEALGAGRLRLRGPAGWSWQLAVARTPAAGQSFRAGAFEVPLPDDDVLMKARVEPSFTGRFGPDGLFELGVPPRLREEAGGASLSACLVLLREPTSPDPVAGVSPAVEVRF